MNITLCLEDKIRHLLAAAVNTAFCVEWPASARVEVCKNFAYGEYTSNVAFLLAKIVHESPIVISEKIISHVTMPDYLAGITTAAPGFINISMSDQHAQNSIKYIMQNPTYGSVEIDEQGSKNSVLLEFVSANPTGPLHVGHGRGAAFGDSLARILSFVGNKVTTEYYVNDAGRQINILLLSIYLRTILTSEHHYPKHAYQGNYIKALVPEFFDKFGELTKAINCTAPLLDENQAQNEACLDDLIAAFSVQISDDNLRAMRTWAVRAILDVIKKDLQSLGVKFDHWFLESSLIDAQDVTVRSTIEQLTKNGYTYEQEGALWFRSTEFGDDKDRVLVRANGEYTYFATDVAYHHQKFKRGYTQLINIWGSDHHGYIPRVQAAQSALGHNVKALQCMLIQFVSLVRGTEAISMSTRSGTFVSIGDLLNEVGKDACRFYFVRQGAQQHMNFDLDLAIAESKDNPVFYVQYAHARVCSLAKHIKVVPSTDEYGFAEPIERQLVVQLIHWPKTVQMAAKTHQPHLITNYLEQLAQFFHSFYNDYKIKGEVESIQQGRYAVCCVVKQVLQTGLSLIGVTAPEQM